MESKQFRDDLWKPRHKGHPVSLHLEALVNAVVLQFFHSADEGVLMQVAPRRDIGPKLWIHGKPEGDCCAVAWIEHVEGAADLLRGQITRVPDLYDDASDISEKTPRDDRHCDEALDQYMYTFTTTAGRCDIELRCSHNGYYGGWLEWSLVEEDKALKLSRGMK